MKIGLVDKLGGISDAIAYAAKKSNISAPKVLYYPLKKMDKWADLFEQLEEEQANEMRVSQQGSMPQELVNYYNQLKSIESMSGMQMRMPFELLIR